MDWQIRIALIIVGAAVIAFIIYDFNRRKKDQIQKQRLIEKMRSSADQIDNLGFDYTGVGNVRKSSEKFTAGDSILNHDTSEHEQLNQSSELSYQQPDGNDAVVDDFRVKQSTKIKPQKNKLSPTEQLDLGVIDKQSVEVDLNKNPDLVFSLILKAKEGETFKGGDFLPILLSQGLRHGDMGIFHRHHGQVGKKPVVLYSVANAINPGTFDIKNIQTFATPAFAFFMTVPGPIDPMMAYEGMVKTIKLLKKELGGQVLDESKSVFTEQTYQHHKDRLQEYLIKSSLKKSKR